jgi:hypothetical protein
MVAHWISAKAIGFPTVGSLECLIKVFSIKSHHRISFEKEKNY